MFFLWSIVSLNKSVIANKHEEVPENHKIMTIKNCFLVGFFIQSD